MAEFFEVVDCFGRKTGKLKTRSLVHRNGDWHRSSHIHLINPRTQTIIFQQRSAGKDVCPNHVDVAVGGHHAPGESEKQTIEREVREEVGIDLTACPGELVRVRGYRLNAIEFPEKNICDHEIQDVSFFVSDIGIDQLSLQRGELFAVMSFAVADVRDLFVGGSDTIGNLAGRRFDERGNVIDYIRSWEKNDFIPAVDNYFAKAAYIADLLFSGERNIPGI